MRRCVYLVCLAPRQVAWRLRSRTKSFPFFDAVLKTYRIGLAVRIQQFELFTSWRRSRAAWSSPESIRTRTHSTKLSPRSCNVRSCRVDQTRKELLHACAQTKLRMLQ